MTTITGSEVSITPGNGLLDSRGQPSANGFTKAGNTWAGTNHDDLPMPGGKTLGQTQFLARALDEAGVTGVNHSWGRDKLAERYAKHLAEIRAEAARKAVDDWLVAAAERSGK